MAILDHKDGILKQATAYLNSKNYHEAVLFYSTYFEHSINSLLNIICQRKKYPHESYRKMVLKIDIEGKYSWLLTILDLPSFNDKYLKAIIRICALRNEYIHYKYKATSFEEDGERCYKDSLNEIDKIIRYLKLYESRVIFGKRKKDLDKFLNNL